MVVILTISNDLIYKITCQSQMEIIALANI